MTVSTYGNAVFIQAQFRDTIADAIEVCIRSHRPRMIGTEAGPAPGSGHQAHRHSVTQRAPPPLGPHRRHCSSCFMMAACVTCGTYGCSLEDTEYAQGCSLRCTGYAQGSRQLLCGTLSVSLSIYLSVSLSTCLSVSQSVCLSVYLSVCLSVWPSVCLSLSGCLSISLSVYLSVCPHLGGGCDVEQLGVVGREDLVRVRVRVRVRGRVSSSVW